MKKKFICFAILILTAYILLYPADAVNASRNGLMLWYEKVLPTLLPFAIISNVLIHSGYMDALTKHLTKYFRFFMPVSGEGVFILCSGFLFGFPMGSKNCAELLKANKIHPKEAEILFYITNNISPVFIGSYILLQQLQLTGMFGISIFILYVPALILGMLLSHRKKEENRQKKTASQSQITFKIIDAAIMNGFETLVRIGGYIMLFSILISLVEKLPLPKPVLILLENVLEITNGINCLANTDWSIQTKYPCNDRHRLRWIKRYRPDIFHGKRNLSVHEKILSCKTVSHTMYFPARCRSQCIFILTYQKKCQS